MPLPVFPLSQRPLRIALAFAMAAAVATPVRAADAHAPAAPGAPAHVGAPDRHAPAPAAAPDGHGAESAGAAGKTAHAAPAESAKNVAARSADPAREAALEVIRQRLTERLNAKPTPSRNTPYDLQVAGRAPNPAPAVRRAVGRGEPAAASADAAHADKPHWGYQGETGPASWAGLHPEFATCATGQRQSPIDIRDGIRVQLEPIRFDYRPSAFSVIDNGHTVQVNVDGGNAIEVLGRRYELQQFHFHRPGEERLDGRSFDMNVHLVHRDPEGRLAVIAILLERGTAQPVVQEIWNNLPLEKHEALPAPHSIDLNGLLPEDRGYYTYMGSLTTPPCSEGVLWMVMRRPQQVSPEQVAVFARLYPMNARPIQSASGRLIKGSQ